MDQQRVVIEAAVQQADKLGINWDELPKVPFWYRSDPKKAVVLGLIRHTVGVRRPLTQPEADAIAYYTRKSDIVRSYSLPIAIVSTVYAERSTSARNGFPFWFPSPEQFERLTGTIERARPFNFERFGVSNADANKSVLRCLRVSAWYLVCKGTASLFLASYAMTTLAANIRRDQRLSQYVADFMATQDKLQGRPVRAASPASQGEGAGGISGGSVQDSQDAPWPAMQSTYAPAQYSQPRFPAQAQAQSQPDDDPFTFDDASPMSSEAQQAQSRAAAMSQRAQAGGGSAWDRIRAQARGEAAAGGQQRSSWTKRRQEDQASQQESFTYSAADEEKSYAKNQAQKEFDEMLERERKGEGESRRRY